MKSHCVVDLVHLNMCIGGDLLGYNCNTERFFRHSLAWLLVNGHEILELMTLVSNGIDGQQSQVHRLEVTDFV